ncbi:uncharacterized protein LOC118183431 [Stegodyphus dumicola]|uniref:uncharacterized protein LOC118183431 n=1 Tax=Stegodyphus dumicola TaxID=202533 RepID=UPI0015AD9766|nr:uncharacterized protein LOC118183431 [Stegodyphus dumicola]
MGIAEEIDPSSEKTGRIYYMPHQPVIRFDKPVRVSIDASSHSKSEYPLKDCLYSAPNLNPPLLEILIQFRTPSIAFTANIEQAFLQISLSPEDRDAIDGSKRNRGLVANNNNFTRVEQTVRLIKTQTQQRTQELIP